MPNLLSAFLRLAPLPLLVAAASPASAQTTRPQTPPAQEELPDLTPQEFEIRGELQVSLPDLRRQPLTGFGPPPRTYVVPAERVPLVLPYGQDLSALDRMTLAPPPAPAATLRQPTWGRLALSGGRYAARAAELDVTSVTSGRALYGRFGYSGQSSYQPFDGVDLDAPENRISGLLGGRFAVGSGVEVQVEGDGFYDRYRLYGATVAALLDGQPDRVGTGGTGEVRATGRGAVPFDLAARYRAANYQIEAGEDDGTTYDADFELYEGRVELDGRVEPVPALAFDAGFATGGFDGGVGGDVQSYSAGGLAQLRLGWARASAGARVLGYSASAANGGGDGFYVAPAGEIELEVGRMTAYGWNRPRVVRRSAADLLRAVPYAIGSGVNVDGAAADGFLLAPDLDVVNAEGGLRYRAETWAVKAYAAGRYSPQALYLTYSPPARGTTTEGSPSGTGLYTPLYDEAVRVALGAEVTVGTPAGPSGTAAIELRDGSLPDLDADLPLYAAAAGRLSGRVPFADGRGYAELSGTAEGARTLLVPDGAGGFEEADADGFATLALGVGYEIRPGFVLSARGEGLAGETERWPGFPEPPLVVTAGLEVRW